MGQYRIDFSAKPYAESAELRNRIEKTAWTSSFNYQKSIGEFIILEGGDEEKAMLDSMAIPDWVRFYPV